MNVELSRDRSIVSKHTALCCVQYTIWTVGFPPVQKRTGEKPIVKIVYWTQHSVVCFETMYRSLLNSKFMLVLDCSIIKLSNLSRNLSRNVEKDDSIKNYEC